MSGLAGLYAWGLYRAFVASQPIQAAACPGWRAEGRWQGPAARPPHLTPAPTLLSAAQATPLVLRRSAPDALLARVERVLQTLTAHGTAGAHQLGLIGLVDRLARAPCGEEKLSCSNPDTPRVHANPSRTPLRLRLLDPDRMPTLGLARITDDLPDLATGRTAHVDATLDLQLGDPTGDPLDVARRGRCPLFVIPQRRRRVRPSAQRVNRRLGRDHERQHTLTVRPHPPPGRPSEYGEQVPPSA
jgi:hypothetical protein